MTRKIKTRNFLVFCLDLCSIECVSIKLIAPPVAIKVPRCRVDVTPLAGRDIVESRPDALHTEALVRRRRVEPVHVEARRRAVQLPEVKLGRPRASPARALARQTLQGDAFPAFALQRICVVFSADSAKERSAVALTCRTRRRAAPKQGRWGQAQSRKCRQTHPC